MKTLKTILKESIIDKDGDVDIYNLPYIENWPKVEDENLDLENWSILSITDTKMVMCGGGDWQEPVKFDVELINDKLQVTNIVNGVFEDGLSEKELLNILK